MYVREMFKMERCSRKRYIWEDSRDKKVVEVNSVSDKKKRLSKRTEGSFIYRDFQERHAQDRGIFEIEWFLRIRGVWNKRMFEI